MFRALLELFAPSEPAKSPFRDNSQHRAFVEAAAVVSKTVLYCAASTVMFDPVKYL